MSDTALQRQIKTLADQLERLRKVDAGGVSNTYTPTYLGGSTAGTTTYSLQQGSYIRVGGLCVVTGTITWTNATGTGNAQISLPFLIPNVSNQNFTGAQRLSGVTFANGSVEVLLLPNTQFFIMQSPATNASPTSVAVETAGTILFTVAYFVE